MPKPADSDSADDDALAVGFGACVTRHREAAAISMTALATKAGMSRAYLWRVEHGHTLPTFRNVARIASALRMPVARLVEGLDITSVTMTSDD